MKNRAWSGLRSVPLPLGRLPSDERTPISAATPACLATVSASYEDSSGTDASVRSPNLCDAEVNSTSIAELSVEVGVEEPSVGDPGVEVPSNSFKVYSIPLISAKCLSSTSARSRAGKSTGVLGGDAGVSTPSKASSE